MGGLPAAAATGGLRGFPAMLTSFIGREEAVRDVAGLLEECRLVTVTGPGGVGKTRLAGQVAGLVAGRFADGAWLAELAAARVEALGAAQLLDRIEGRFALLMSGDRLAADRQRSLAATAQWSYRLLEDGEQRVFRAVAVFPAGFTLDGAEAVAGPGAGAVVLRLVDCSLLSPPRAGPDGRSRYVMLETLRAYAAGLLTEAGEQDGAAAALAGYALRVARLAAAGLLSGDGELAAGRWLDAEDPTMRQVLGWAVAHDPALALRLADALGWWWVLRDGLRVAVRTGLWFELRIGLFQCANLCAATGRAAEALTLWAAVAAVAAAGRHQAPTGPPWLVSRWQEQMGQARQALGPGRAREAEDRGAAMSLATAAEYALMLTDPGPPHPAAPGPGELSARERELVRLVAQGRTNAQIAAELHISVRTIGSHLDRIRDKTGCRRRADLTRLALAAGLV